MRYWKTIEKDGLPPVGIPLIVTVEGKGDQPKLAYPVIYRKSFIRDEWHFYEHGYEDGLIGPDYFKVTAWQVMPKPYGLDQEESDDGWISVETKLPELNQETWVYAIPPAGFNDDEPMIDTDTFTGNRGHTGTWHEPTGPENFTASGWFAYTGWNVTHWQPVVAPDPPKELTSSRRAPLPLLWRTGYS